MKRIITALALMGILGAAHAAPQRIAVVDMQNVVAMSPDAKSISEAIQKEFSVKEEAIVAMEKKLVEQGKKLERDQAILSESERQKYERELMGSQRELQRAQYEFREALSARQRSEMNALVDKIRGHIESVAKAEGYDLVVFKDAVAYSAAEQDLTGKVSQALVKAAKTGGNQAAKSGSNKKKS